jgi:hypothetical protein
MHPALYMCPRNVPQDGSRSSFLILVSSHESRDFRRRRAIFSHPSAGVRYDVRFFGQGLAIKFGSGSFYFANKRAALGEFAQVSPTEVEIGRRFQLLDRGKVTGRRPGDGIISAKAMKFAPTW